MVGDIGIGCKYIRITAKQNINPMKAGKEMSGEALVLEKDTATSRYVLTGSIYCKTVMRFHRVFYYRAVI